MRPLRSSPPGLRRALGARLIEQAGFDAVYMTGFGTTASLLGRPDVGPARRHGDGRQRPPHRRGRRRPAHRRRRHRLRQRHQRRAHRPGLRAGRRRRRPPRGPGDAQEVRAHERQAGRRRAEEMVGKIRGRRRRPARPRPRDHRPHRRARRRRSRRRDRPAPGATRDAGADVLFVEAPTSEAEIEPVATELAAWLRWCSTGPRAARPRRCPDRIGELGFSLVIFPIAHAAGRHCAVRRCSRPSRRRHAHRGDGCAAHLRRVHRPDRAAGGAGAGAALPRAAERPPRGGALSGRSTPAGASPGRRRSPRGGPR